MLKITSQQQAAAPGTTSTAVIIARGFHDNLFSRDDFGEFVLIHVSDKVTLNVRILLKSRLKQE